MFNVNVRIKTLGEYVNKQRRANYYFLKCLKRKNKNTLNAMYYVNGRETGRHTEFNFGR